MTRGTWLKEEQYPVCVIDYESPKCVWPYGWIVSDLIKKAFKSLCVFVLLNWSIRNENLSLFISLLDNPSEFRGLGPVLLCTWTQRFDWMESVLHTVLCICDLWFKAARLITFHPKSCIFLMEWLSLIV